MNALEKRRMEAMERALKVIAIWACDIDLLQSRQKVMADIRNAALKALRVNPDSKAIIQKAE